MLHLTILLLLLCIGLVVIFLWGAALYRKREVVKFFSKPIIFPNERSRFKTIDGVKLHYLCEGSGPDIILIHGLGANIYCWRFLIPLLAQKNRVWAIDLKGFGQSEKPTGSNYTFEGQAVHLLKFIESENIKSATVVGNSMGGGIAAVMALEAKEYVKNLVLINSAHDKRMFGFNHQALGLLMRVASPLVNVFSPLINTTSLKGYFGLLYGKNYKFTEDDIKAYLEPYVQGSAPHLAFVEAYNGLVHHNLTSRLKALTNHVLILWGKEDKLLPVRFGQMLHHELPSSRYFVHPTGGHHLQEEEPEWVAEKIQEFISETKD